MKSFVLFVCFAFRFLLKQTNLLANSTFMTLLRGFTGSCNLLIFFFEGDMMEEDNEVILNMYKRTLFKVRRAAQEEKLFSDN